MCTLQSSMEPCVYLPLVYVHVPKQDIILLKNHAEELAMEIKPADFSVL